MTEQEKGENLRIDDIKAAVDAVGDADDDDDGNEIEDDNSGLDEAAEPEAEAEPAP